MLSTDLSPYLIGFLTLVVILSILCVRFLVKLSAYCKDAVEFVQNQNKNAVSLRRMADVEVALTELTDSYESLLVSHKKLRSRIGMRKTREDAKESVLLDPEAEKALRKSALRIRAKQNGLIR